MTNDDLTSADEEAALTQLVELYERTDNPVQLRTSSEFARFFGDWPLWSPGLVYAPLWRPDRPDGGHALVAAPSQSRILAGAAEKQGRFGSPSVIWVRRRPRAERPSLFTTRAEWSDAAINF